MRRSLLALRFALVVALLQAWGGDVARAQGESRRADARAESAEPPELETDRDAFTPATGTVRRRVSVLETSYSFIDNRDVKDTHSLPELLVRRGLTDHIELRLGWNYEVGGAGNVVSGNEGGGDESAGGALERESELLYGLKAQLTEQRGLLPRSALILQGYTPTSGASPATDWVGAYAFGWELPNRMRLDSSMRYGTDHAEHDVANQWMPSVVLRAPLTERWQVHAEYFGIYTDGGATDDCRAFFSTGTHYLIAPNVELGVRIGWGLTHDAPNAFSNLGLGGRF